MNKLTNTIALILAVLTLLLMLFVFGYQVANAATEYPLGYPSSPLQYLGMMGEKCQIGNRGGYWDDYYPGDPRWFCRGEVTCNGVYYSFAVQSTATLSSTEARPLVTCGERGDDTLYLTLDLWDDDQGARMSVHTARSCGRFRFFSRAALTRC